MMFDAFLQRLTPAKLFIVLAIGIVVSNLHFLTPTHNHYLHLVYDRLCYFPVILSAFWFGLWGGLIMGIAMSAMHLLHIGLQWGGDFLGANLYQTLEAAVHILLGVVTGVLSERFLQTAKKLEQSYADLREKTEQVLNAEEHLRRTERIQALAELSAGVSHEIRTPLSSIKGAAEILAKPDLPSEQRQEFTGIMLKEINHLNHVVNEFLNFARPREQRRGYCDLRALLNSVLELTLQQCRSRNIRVSTAIDDGLPSLYFDPDQLRQVLVNLINNAIQMMPNGGELIVSCVTDDGALICRIEDSGPGIPDEVHSRIFDPFFTTRPNGTGLGLSIVQKIMNQHGGSVEAANRDEGGACFQLRFPLTKGSNGS
ncbi:MAG: sensor histidine kinase [bacterium]|nr:sensor histidine kinase [bacterium]